VVRGRSPAEKQVYARKNGRDRRSGNAALYACHDESKPICFDDNSHIFTVISYLLDSLQLECGSMPNVMAALPNIGDGALCSTSPSLAYAHYSSAVQ